MPPRENSVRDSFFLSRLPDSEKLDQILKIESKKSSMEDASPEKVVIKNTQYFSEPELSPSTSPMGSRPSSPICSDTEFESAKRERVKDSAASQDQHEQVSHSFLCQALFFCNICVVFMPVLPFGDLLFIHASTNATDDHEYSLFPSQILTVPEFEYHLAKSFSCKMSLLTLRGFFERLRAPSQSQKGQLIEKTKLKK